MDPITVLSTSATVLHVTRNVLEFAISFKDGAGGYQKQLNDLTAELESLQSVVRNVEICLKTPDLIQSLAISGDACNAILHGLDNSLRNCAQSVEDFGELFADFDPDEKIGWLHRGARAKRLNWRFDEFVEVRQKLQTHQGAIQVSLSTIHMRIQMQSKAQDAGEFRKLHSEINEMSANLRKFAKTKKELEKTQTKNQTLGAEATRVFLDLDELQSKSEAARREAQKELRKRSILYGHKVAHAGEQDKGDDGDGPATISGDLTPSVEKKQHSQNDVLDRQKLSVPHAIRPYSSTPALVNSNAIPEEEEVDPNISSEAFEKSINAIINGPSRQKRPNRPFSDTDFDKIGDLLQRVGKPQWAERPRTYLVLRLIQQVNLMDDFVLHGMKDINFPYTSERLPQFVRGHSVRHEFLQQQTLVLSPKSADLIKGGKHRHIGGNQGADSIFTVIRTLGRGGQGVVDVVRHKMAWQEFARKRIHRSRTFAKDRKALETFENEVHNLKRLEHDHLVRFVGSYTDFNYVGIIMDPVADCDLRQYFDETIASGLDEDHVGSLRRFMGCLCAAVQYLHQHRCRHKDLKPANILIKNDTVLITDFGIALDSTEMDRDTTNSGFTAHTTAYAAPEVINLAGRRSFPADVYSLGCVYLDIMTILKGQKLDDREEFFTQEGTRLRYSCQNPEALLAWIEVLEELEEDEPNTPLTWVRRMTAADPELRPTATSLLAEIQSASQGDYEYSGACCGDDASTGVGDEDSWQGSDSDGEVHDTEEGDTRGTMGSYDDTIDSALLQHDDVTEPTLLTVASVEQEHGEPAIDDQNLSVTKGGAADVPAISFTEAVDDDVPSKDFPQRDRKHELQEQAPKNTNYDQELPSEPSGTIGSGYHQGSQTTGDLGPDSPPPDLDEAVDRIQELFHSDTQSLEKYLLEQWHVHGPSWFSACIEQLESSDLTKKRYTLLHVAADFQDAGLAYDVMKPALATGADPNAFNFAGNTPLHYAAGFVDKMEVVQLLLAQGADVHKQNLRVQTPLHIAARQGSPETLEALIKATAYDHLINSQDDRGRTPLHLAVQADTLRKASLLIEAGANPRLTDYAGCNCLSLCRADLRDEFENMLTSSGFTNDIQQDPLSPTRNSEDPCGCETCRILTLVESLKDNEGELILKCPCSFHFKRLALEMVSSVQDLENDIENCNCDECFKAMATYEEVSKQTDNCDCAQCEAKRQKEPAAAADTSDEIQYYDQVIDGALDQCSCSDCEVKNADTATAILMDGGFTGKRAFANDPTKAWTWAIDQCESRDDRSMTSIAKLLLYSGASIESRDSKGRTMLHKAAICGHLALAKYLIDNRADLESARSGFFASKRGFTPLKYAVWECKGAMTRLLLREGANIDNHNDNEGDTVFHDVVKNWEELGEMLPVLLAHPANQIIADDVGYTAFSNAVWRDNLDAVRMFVQAGADVDETWSSTETPVGLAIMRNNPEMVRYLIESGARLRDRGSAILYAATHGSGACVAELLAFKRENNIAEDSSSTTDASIDGTFNTIAFDTSHRTPLHLIANAKALEIQACLEDLLQEFPHAAVDCADQSGNTALHTAANAGSAYMVRHLLSCGANSALYNVAGKTAVDLARAKKHKEIVEMLGGEMSVKKRWWK